MQRTKRFFDRRLRFIFGSLLACLLYAELQFRDEHVPVLIHGAPIVLASDLDNSDPFERLVRKDPLEALRQARRWHQASVKDYACTMIKQERLAGGMSAEQEMEVKFRQEPYSVVMTWIRNPGLAKRVIYVKDKWIDDKDRQLAVCQPGDFASVFVKSIKQPVRGTLAKRSARRSIDEFGFARTLDLLIKYCEAAQSRNELKLTYEGDSQFDGRPVWVIRRHLPFIDDEGPYPDRTADIYLDKEFKIPLAVYTYSDDACEPRNLLGKYEYRDIRLDIGLAETDFEPATYGM